MHRLFKSTEPESFLVSFKAIKSVYGPFQLLFTDRYDSPLPLISVNKWNPYPFIYLKPEKGAPFRASLPVRDIIRCTPRTPPSPPTPTVHDSLNKTSAFKFREALQSTFTSVNDLFHHRKVVISFFKFGCCYPNLSIGWNIFASFIQNLQLNQTFQRQNNKNNNHSTSN